MISHRTDGRGISLVEVLVVVGIIGLLISLLIPAVSQSREAARRTQCLGRLRQLGLAMAAYHGDFLALPAGCHNMLDPRYRSAATDFRDRSAFVFLLPYLERPDLVDMHNSQTSILAPENRTLVQSPINLFACPSDWRGGVPLPTAGVYPHPFRPAVYPTDVVTRASFGLCQGSWRPSDVPPAAGTIHDVPRTIIAQFDGCFYCWKSIKYSEITDGLAKTLFIAEMTDPLYCEAEESRRFNWWMEGRLGGVIFATMSAPNRRGVNEPLASAGSKHAGGFHALFGDGSAAFLSNEIDSWPTNGFGMPLGATVVNGVWTNLPPRRVWQAMGSRAGNEAL